LTHLVVATLYTFGLQRGVGVDTMRAFFARLRLERQVGCSPSALRGVLHALEVARLETAGTWKQDACARAEVRESIGAVDATFLEPMILVLMDLRTGYLLLEDVAEDRTSATWKARVEARRTALCRAPDGTTPAARFFRRTFPDLFETVLSHIEALTQPWKRKRQVALCH
jgi:hypothetical protein